MKALVTINVGNITVSVNETLTDKIFIPEQNRYIPVNFFYGSAEIPIDGKMYYIRLEPHAKPIGATV